jgi:integrase/recombinase XerD
MDWINSIKLFQNYLKIERGLSKNSILNYTNDIKSLINFINEKKLKITPKECNNDIIKEFLYNTSPNVKSSSQSRRISGLKSFFNFLMFEKKIKISPIENIESPKIGRTLPETLSIKEIEMLIESIDLTHPQGPRNKAIIETLYGSGLRVSELINLKISDLYFDEDLILINGKGNKQRLVPMGNMSKKQIKIYISDHRKTKDIKYIDTLFLNRNGRNISRVMIFNIVNELAKKNNIKKKISPHTFRHSFATHILENGADLRTIQQMMGHENITTTEIYMHLDSKHLLAELEKFHPRNI